jgi:glycosyltransferase involved in cell wall biosynthesis
LKNKKIALIAHYGEDYYKSRVDFLNFLEENNMDCISFVPDDDYRSKIESLDKKVYYYNYSRSWRFIFSLITVYKFFVKTLRAEKPALLFTYKFFPNCVGILAGRRVKISKIVATVAGIGFLEKRDESFLIKLVFLIYIYILDKATIVVAQNLEDKILLQKHLRKAHVMMTNGSGVNAENLIVDNYEGFLLDNLLNKNKRYITFCSRILKDKGILELISAYNAISKDEQFPYDLIIAGWFDEKGLEERVVEATKINPRIHMIGYQKNVANLLEISEVFTLPSYYPEGVPRSLIEATAMSKIIITTDHKGCKETCIDGYNGFLVQPRSSESLIEVFNRLALMNEGEIAVLKQNSRDLFSKKFDRSVVFKSILNGVS